MADWSRVVNTTLRRYQKDAEPTLVRNLPLTAALEAAGRIQTNVSGDGYDWAVEYQRADVQGNSGNTALVFDAVDRYVRCYLEYRGYVATDSLKKRDFLKNRSPEALIKYYDKMGPKLFDDMERKLAVEQYIDGNANGNSERLHGLDTIFGTAGTTLNVDTGAVRAYNAGDYVFAPDDSYAGIDTDLAAYGGSWSGPWPDSGEGSDTYDFFSPVLVNYESSAFAQTSNTWKDNCVEAIRFGLTALQKDASVKGIADMAFLDRRMFRQLKTKLATTEKTEITANSKLRSYGFRDSIEIDGCAVMGVFGCPAGVGYMLNTNHVSMVSMQKRLFEIEGPVWDMQTRCWRTVCDFLGDLIFDSPKFFGKLRPQTLS